MLIWKGSGSSRKISKHKVMKTKIISISEVHLIVRIGKDFYGIPVSKTFNIIEISRITSFKQSNDLVIGNVNLRGALIPIVDLHTKFGTKQDDYTYNSSVLVFEINKNNCKFFVGILIDALHEVTEIKMSEIDYNIGILHTSCNGCIKGFYQRNKQMNIGIIEPENIFTTDEISMLKNSV